MTVDSAAEDDADNCREELARFRTRYPNGFDDADEADVKAIVRFLLRQSHSTLIGKLKTFVSARSGLEYLWQLVTAHGKFVDALLEIKEEGFFWNDASGLPESFQILMRKCQQRAPSQEWPRAWVGGTIETKAETNDNPRSSTQLAETALGALIARTEATEERTREVNGIMVSDFHLPNRELIQNTQESFGCLIAQTRASIEAVKTSLQQKQREETELLESQLRYQEAQVASETRRQHNMRNDVLDEYLQQLQFQEETLELIGTTVASILDWINTDQFRQKGRVLRLLRNLEPIPRNISSLADPWINLAVCGPTGVGKTTFMESILGVVRCLPTSDRPNTVIPIRVIHDEAVGEPELTLPNALVENIFDMCHSICAAISYLKDSPRVATDIPFGSILPEEAHHMYKNLDAIALGEQLSEFVRASFPPRTVGAPNVLATINALTGLVRLAYHLPMSRRFKPHLPEDSMAKWMTALRGGNPLEQLPTIRVCCKGLKEIPLVGKLAFIDTPGVTEGGISTQFGAFTKEVTNIVAQKASKIIVLATPQHHRTDTFQILLETMKAARQNGSIALVFNKMDIETVDVQRIANKMTEYAREYGDQGVVDVHWMRAKMVHEFVWGFQAVETIGIAALLQNGEARQHPDFQVADDLMNTALSEFWREDFSHSNHAECAHEIMATLGRRKKLYMRRSNVDHVMTSNALSATALFLPRHCLKCVRRLLDGLTAAQTETASLLASVRNAESQQAVIAQLKSAAAQMRESSAALETLVDRLGTPLADPRDPSDLTEQLKRNCISAESELCGKLEGDINSKIALLQAESIPRVKRHTEYFWKDESAADTAENKVDIESDTCYTFPSQKAADDAHKKMLEEVNKIFSDRKVEQRCEDDWNNLVNALLHSSRDALLKRVDDVCKQADEAGVDLSEQLEQVKTNIASRITRSFGNAKIDRLLMPTIQMRGGVGKSWVWHYHVIPWKHNVVFFDACRMRAHFTIADEYKASALFRKVISGGKCKLAQCVGAVAEDLQQQATVLEELATDIAKGQAIGNEEALASMQQDLVTSIAAGAQIQRALETIIGERTGQRQH